MTRTRLAAALWACAAAPALAQSPASPRDSVVVRAMRDELTRTMAELRLEKAERPYFVAYTITERDGLGATASYGSLAGANRSVSRALNVEVRVGDYTFDNTNFFSAPMMSAAGIRAFYGVIELPLDDDYVEIRRQIWLATDAAYKQAVETVAGKRAALLNRTRPDSLPDFTKDEITHTTDELRPIALDHATIEPLVRDLSRAGVSPGIYASNVSVSAANTRVFYLNSEGTSFVRSRPLVTLTATASTQAADGMPLSNTLRLAARSMDAFPTREQLAAQIRELHAQLDTVRNAPVVARYNGPVLFEGRAAAELFSEQFGTALAASRKPVASDPSAERFAAILGRGTPRGGTSLSEKIGGRVLPEFLSVVDDPTTTVYARVPLLGGYVVDDQGVRARATRLIESGILKTLLASRTPVEGAPRSTGNSRGGSVSPSNVIVEVNNGLSDAALRERLLALAKARGLPFAIVVRVMGSAAADDVMSMVMAAMPTSMPGGAVQGRHVLLAYRIYPDGHEECVRGAQVMGLGVDAFKGIVAASSSTTVLHGYGSGGLSGVMAAASGAMASYVVPSLLFDDLTVSRRQDEAPKPPISAPPQ